MLKMIALFLMLTITVTGTVSGQVLSDKSKKSGVSLKRAILEETERYKNEAVGIDAEKMEKMQRQPQPGLSKTKQVLLVTVIVGVLVGLAIVLAYNTKRCIKREPSGCDFVNDINCKCVQYAE